MKKFILSLLVLLPLISACGDDSTTEESNEETVVVDEEKEADKEPTHYDIAMKVTEVNSAGVDSGEIASLFEEEMYESKDFAQSAGAELISTIFEKSVGEVGSYKEYFYSAHIPNEAVEDNDSFYITKVSEEYMIMATYGLQSLAVQGGIPDFNDREEVLIMTMVYNSDDNMNNTLGLPYPIDTFSTCTYRYNLMDEELVSDEFSFEGDCEEVASEDEINTFIGEFFEELYNIYW